MSVGNAIEAAIHGGVLVEWLAFWRALAGRSCAPWPRRLATPLCRLAVPGLLAAPPLCRNRLWTSSAAEIELAPTLHGCSKAYCALFFLYRVEWHKETRPAGC